MAFAALRSRPFYTDHGTTPPAGSAPTVTTSAATSVTEWGATGNGDVTSDGGQTITERGFCWSFDLNPTIADPKIIASGNTGAYTATLGPLGAGASYHYRAYATNSIGTSYGADTVVSTLRMPQYAFVNFQNPGVL